MALNKLMSFVKNSIVGSSLPSDSEEGRQFLQERIAFFGKVGGMICLGAIISHHLTFLFDPQRSWQDWSHRLIIFIQLATLAVFIAMWRLCCGKPREPRTLLAIDALGLVLICAGAALITLLENWILHKSFWTVLIATNVLFFRALLVPSSA